MATGTVLSYTNMLQAYSHANAALLQTNERQIMLARQVRLYLTCISTLTTFLTAGN